MAKYTILVGSVGEVNGCYGIYNTKKEAVNQLAGFMSNLWANAEPYSGVIIPLNEQDKKKGE